MAFIGLPRAISWGDFTELEERPEGEDEDAYTKAKWNLTYGFPAGIDYTLNNITVSMSMVTSESWVVKSAKSADLLKHEQGHYDITALGARDLHRQLPDLKAKTEKALRAAVKALEQKVQTEIDAMNDKYD